MRTQLVSFRGTPVVSYSIIKHLQTESALFEKKMEQFGISKRKKKNLLKRIL